MIICICILVANTGNYCLRFFVEIIATSKKFNLHKIYPFPFTIACASFVNIIDNANYLNRKTCLKVRWDGQKWNPSFIYLIKSIFINSTSSTFSNVSAILFGIKILFLFKRLFLGKRMVGGTLSQLLFREFD